MADTIRVEIFGTEYPIKGDVDSDYIEKVARYVDKKMREVAEEHSLVSPSKVAILAAMYITDELFKERDEGRKLTAQIELRVEKLNRRLEEGLRGK